MGSTKPKKRQRKTRLAAANLCHWLVLVDQSRLRAKAQKEARQLQREVDRLRMAQAQFEQSDVPAHARWMAQHFGALLSQIRELETQFAEKSRWADAIQTEMFWSDCSAYEAYCLVKRAFEGNGESDDSDGEDPFFEEDVIEELSSKESFDSMLREVFGIDPKKMPRKEYDAMFASFREGFEDAREEAKRDAPPEEECFHWNYTEFANAGENHPDDQRCKSLYRALVRRLHPDVRADGNPTVASIWHEVQTAYQERDLARLQTLMALADLVDSDSEGVTWKTTSLNELREVVRELRRTAKALRASLEHAKRQPEWRFATQSDHSVLFAQTEIKLNRAKAQLVARLASITSQLEAWSQPPPRRTRTKRKRKSRADYSMDIPF